MRKHARHSGLIEDAPLPTWRIHYLWVFTNFNWHFYQLWTSVSDLATLGVSVLPQDENIGQIWLLGTTNLKNITVRCRFLIALYECFAFLTFHGARAVFKIADTLVGDTNIVPCTVTFGQRETSNVICLITPKPISLQKIQRLFLLPNPLQTLQLCNFKSLTGI